jgi:tripartite-type tricarboxylate transporter receptor subunit TctC
MASSWSAVGAPENTPAEIIQKLNKEINAGLGDPEIKVWLADLGAMTFAGSPADFGTFIAEEAEKWGKVIRAQQRGTRIPSGEACAGTSPTAPSRWAAA